MPNWKKVIVSGSAAQLFNVTSSGQVSASLGFIADQLTTGFIGTASFAGGVADDGVKTAAIADEQVTLAKLAHAAANTVLVRDANNAGDPSFKAVTNTQLLIGDGTGFTAAALSGDATMANNGVVTIEADAVTYAKMQNLGTGNRVLGATSAGVISEVQVDTLMIANDAIEEEQIGDGEVKTAALANDAVDADKLAANAVVNASIASNAAIVHSKLAAIAATKLLVGNGSNVPTAVALSGDVTMNNAGAVTIENDAVDGDKLADNITIAGNLAVTGHLNLGAGTAKTIQLGSQRAYTLPAQGTRMRVLTLADHTYCRVFLESSENARSQPIVLDIHHRAQGDEKPKIIRSENYEWHAHSNDIRFTSDSSGGAGGATHIYFEKVAYSTGRSVNIRKVETFDGTCTILDGSTTNTGGGAEEAISALGLTDGKILIGDSNDASAEFALSGDATMNRGGVVSIVNDKVITAKILNANVTRAKIAADAIDSTKIDDGAVDTEHIAADAIEEEHIGAGEVKTAALANDAVDADKLASDAVVNASVAAGAAIVFTKLENLDSTKMLVGNGSNKAAEVAISGDVSMANTGAVTIGNGKVLNAMLEDAAVDTEELADDAVNADKLAADAVVNASVAAGAAIVFTKLENLDSTKMLVGNGSNKAAEVTISGDITMANNGAVTLVNDKVITTKILDGNVTRAKIEADAIDATKIEDNAVDTEHIADDAIEEEHIGAGEIKTAAIANDAITGDKTANNIAITTTGVTTLNNFLVMKAAKNITMGGLLSGGVGRMNMQHNDSKGIIQCITGPLELNVNANGVDLGKPNPATGVLPHVTASGIFSGSGFVGDLVGTASYAESITGTGLTDGKILIGDSNGAGAEFALSGDATMTRGGVVTTGKINGVAIAAVQATQVAAISDVTISTTQWGYVGGANQNVKTTSNVAFANVATTGTTALGNANTDTVTILGNVTASGDISGSSDSNIIMNRRFKRSTTLNNNLAQGDITHTGGQGTIAAGDIVYMNTSGNWIKAKANSLGSSTPLLGIALGSDAGDDGILLRGMFTLDHDVGNNQGIPLYLSTGTAGAAQVAVPSADGHVVRIIGYNLGNDDQIWFSPDNTFIEVA